MSNLYPEEAPKLQAFKVNLSKGDALPCDKDELPQIILSIKTGSPCKIRSGVFNPSYYVSITEDRERISEIERINDNIRKNNDREYSQGKGTDYQQYKDLTPIKDIFEGINLSSGSQIQQPSEGKRDTRLPAPPPAAQKLQKLQKLAKKTEEGEYRVK